MEKHDAWFIRHSHFLGKQDKLKPYLTRIRPQNCRLVKLHPSYFSGKVASPIHAPFF